MVEEGKKSRNKREKDSRKSAKCLNKKKNKPRERDRFKIWCFLAVYLSIAMQCDSSDVGQRK